MYQTIGNLLKNYRNFIFLTRFLNLAALGTESAAVQYILDTVTAELRENSSYRFSYCEMAFFSRWWNQQSNEMKDEVRKLVANGSFT